MYFSSDLQQTLHSHSIISADALMILDYMPYVPSEREERSKSSIMNQSLLLYHKKQRFHSIILAAIYRAKKEPDDSQARKRLLYANGGRDRFKHSSTFSGELSANSMMVERFNQNERKFEHF